MNQGNAFSLGASNALANQGEQGTAAQNTATPSQTAQTSAGGTQPPDANIDMGQSTDAHTDAPAANGGYPYQGILMGADGGVKNTTSVPNQITAESIYKYLQSIGQIDKKVDYNAAIDELAKAFAEERVKRMTDDDKREYLVSHGIGNDIASIVIPEANAKARDKARQEAIAKMAASATNPMMAEALSLMALTDGTKPSDFMDAIGKTKPEMGFNDLDLGGTKMRTMYDKNGWLKPEAAQFVKTLSPNEIVVSRDKAAGRQLRANIADAEIKKDLAVAKANNSTRYATTKMQQEGANWRKQYEQENANWRAQYRGQNGGSGGRAAGGKGGEKLTQAQQHFLNEFSNRYLAAKQAITDGYSEDDHGLQELTDFLYDDGRKMLSPEDFRKFEAYVYALQGYMWKQHAIDDPTDENAENQAMEHWRHVPPEILEEEFPGYNFDAYK